MSSCRRGLAVLAAWLALVGTSRAQQYIPTPVGAARMPEPMACPPEEPLPKLAPGPINPWLAPPGPPDCLSLPDTHSSAFQCEQYALEQRWFAAAGPTALQRQRMGKFNIASLDSVGLDTGFVNFPPTGITVQRTEDIIPDVAFGVRATVGYLWGNQAVELNGFYIPDNTKSDDKINPGKINVFFHNPPIGFEGDNGLWLQADRLYTRFTTGISGADLNYRLWNSGFNHVELLMGVRFVHLRENLSIFTDDDGFTFHDVNGLPDPVRQATYGTQTNNYIIGPQLGAEYATPCPLPILSWIWVGGVAKAAAGPNIININNTLTRGDGFVGFNNRHNTVSFGQVYELTGYFDFYMFEKCKLRAGYTAMWLVGIATASDQVDFNLANPYGRHNTHGTALFHGPQIELQFLF